MAAKSIKKIKTRIKSIQSTRRITNAMKLVAVSKSKKMTEKMDAVRPYCKEAEKIISDIAADSKNSFIPYFRKGTGKVCCIVIAGDRGLAGGYNINIMRAAEKFKDAEIIPIGKKACEHFFRSEKKYESAEDFTAETAAELAEYSVKKFCRHEFCEINILYTKFINMLSYEPSVMRILPVEVNLEKNKKLTKTTYEPSAEEVLDTIIPMYSAGMIYGTIREALASETISRRVAMEAATSNADEMIENLKLDYNRARQGAVTQELTEIVSGAGMV